MSQERQSEPSECRGIAGLYLHIPFCSAICPYCDFAVLLGDRERRQRFIEHLLTEIRFYADCEQRFDTVYFGGGTPSLLEADDLGRVLAEIGERLRLADGTEIFLEANPEDVTAAKARQWRALGVSTLSLGVQSFDAEVLRFLGRRHGTEQSRCSVELALEAGFTTVSADLIYGLPGQDVERWRQDLSQVLALGPHHLSCYQLTVCERTPFWYRRERGELSELPEEEQAHMFCWTHEFLNRHGFQGYEVSNFAASAEHRSRHNCKYWSHAPYLGLGPSAHSYFHGRRWWNVRKIKPYEARLSAGQKPVEGSEALSRSQLLLEALMLGLRTYQGIDLNLLQRRFGFKPTGPNAAVIEELAGRGLAVVDGSRVRPTIAGLAVADTLARSFELPEN